ncbi:MAG TPA: hypothetical protein VF974_01575 [Patescibacteria group bacterium]
MKFIFLGAVIFLSACNNNSVKDGEARNATIDSLREKPVYKPNKDSNTLARSGHKDTVLPHDAIDDENPSDDLLTILKQCTDRYTHPVLIDSTYIIGGDTFHIHLKHYCLRDSGIVIPKSYVYMYKLDSFVTHNFVSMIRLDKNSQTILQKTIYKKDFEQFLDRSLQKYGALLLPYIYLENNTIKVGYSISVPLTDVGIGVSMLVNRDGSIVFKGH